MRSGERGPGWCFVGPRMRRRGGAARYDHTQRVSEVVVRNDVIRSAEFRCDVFGLSFGRDEFGKQRDSGTGRLRQLQTFEDLLRLRLSAARPHAEESSTVVSFRRHRGDAQPQETSIRLNDSDLQLLVSVHSGFELCRAGPVDGHIERTVNVRLISPQHQSVDGRGIETVEKAPGVCRQPRRPPVQDFGTHGRDGNASQIPQFVIRPVRIEGGEVPRNAHRDPHGRDPRS